MMDPTWIGIGQLVAAFLTAIWLYRATRTKDRATIIRENAEWREWLRRHATPHFAPGEILPSRPWPRRGQPPPWRVPVPQEQTNTPAPRLSISDAEIEEQIRAKGLNAPRVTPQKILDAIAAEYYFTAQEGVEGALLLQSEHAKGTSHESLKLLTFCVLVMKNGFTVTGESACASPENFDAQLGREAALKNAMAKVWALEGYLLKQRLAETPREG